MPATCFSTTLGKVFAIVHENDDENEDSNDKDNKEDGGGDNKEVNDGGDGGDDHLIMDIRNICCSPSINPRFVQLLPHFGSVLLIWNGYDLSLDTLPPRDPGSGEVMWSAHIHITAE